MRTQEAMELDDLSFEESLDITAAMALRDPRPCANAEDAEIGLRALLENPEALSKSFRRQLH